MYAFQGPTIPTKPTTGETVSALRWCRGTKTRPPERDGRYEKMADIDTAADIGVEQSDGHLIVSIPLVGELSKQWLGNFMKFAQKQNLPAQVREGQVVVAVPVAMGQGDVLSIMNNVRDLVAKVNEAEPAPEAAAQTEAVIRDWWRRERG